MQQKNFCYSIFLKIIFFCFLQTNVNAQDVNGQWYANGKVNLSGDFNSYLAEIDLKQAGSFVMGEFNFYFKNKYYSNKISGTFNKKTREIIIKPINIIYYKSKTENSVECLMEGKFKLLINNLGSYLDGSFNSTKNYSYGCPSILFKFAKSNPSIKTDKGKEISLVEKEPIVLPEKKLIPSENIKLQRTEVIIKEILVDSSKIKMALYDNGEYDNDTVTLFYNNKLLAFKNELSDKNALYFTIDVNTEPNSLVMFAENLGKFPPNTALLILWDGNKRHEITITSNLNESGKVIIRKRF